jgi:hypothetical protein
LTFQDNKSILQNDLISGSGNLEAEQRSVDGRPVVSRNPMAKAMSLDQLKVAKLPLFSMRSYSSSTDVYQEMQKDTYGDKIYTPLQRWLEEIPGAEHWHAMKRALPLVLSDKAIEAVVNGQLNGHIVHETQNENN